MPSGPPGPGVRVPEAVTRLAAGPVRPVWKNQKGGLTFAAGDLHVKWSPPGFDFSAEATRLTWASRFTPVPSPVETGHDEAGSWLVTRTLPGESAVTRRWLAEPATAVRAVGEGLRALHEALPVDGCPFSWEPSTRLARMPSSPDPSRWHPAHRRLGADRALSLLADPPETDVRVVCHGDPCAPNTLLTRGRWSGHVDLGALGVADRWADLAVATWNTWWNYGPGWEDLLLAAYGVRPDPERTRYYRLLWDLTP